MHYQFDRGKNWLSYIYYRLDGQKLKSLKQWRKVIAWITDKEDDFPFFTTKRKKDLRTIPLKIQNLISRLEPIIDDSTGFAYANNRIQTSRYTILNFFFKQLLLLYSNYAYIFLTFVALLQLMPGLSITGWAPVILPILFWFSIEMISEGIADRRRWKRDRIENNSLSLIMTFDETNQTINETVMPRKKLVVGDIVKLYENDIVPADLVLIGRQSFDGRVYIETSSLDGEIDFKSRFVPQCLVDIAERYHGIETAIKYLEGKIEAEHPNSNLHSFNGRITLQGEVFKLTNDHVVYRGCSVRNCEAVWGVVVYTGSDTKYRLNSARNSSTKLSTFSHKLNRIILFIVVMVLGLTTVYAVLAEVKYVKKSHKFTLLKRADSSFFNTLFVIFFFYSALVPLSLYTLLKGNRFIQKFFIENDLDCYDEKRDMRTAVDAVDLVDEIGRIDYILTDKTGTLTENNLTVRKISLFGHKFNHRTTASQTPISSSLWPGKEIFTTAQLLEYCRDRPSSLIALRTHEYLIALTLCHTCLPKEYTSTSPLTPRDSNNQAVASKSRLEYAGASQDEIAILEAARDMGFILWERNGDVITVKIQLSEPDSRTTEVFKIRSIIEFSSIRRRMSIVMEDLTHKRLLLISKGADESILGLLKGHSTVERLERAVHLDIESRHSTETEAIRSLLPRMSFGEARSASIEKMRPSLDTRSANLDDTAQNLLSGEKFLKETIYHINQFADEGLRVLVYAMRQITEQELERYLEAEANFIIDGPENESEYNRARESLESDLELLGAVAIEDTLQEKVCDALFAFQRAKIKVWMVTGDKMGTAKNIARACSILTEVSEILHLHGTAIEMQEAIKYFIDQCDQSLYIHTVVLIEGDSISNLLDSPEGFLISKFLLSVDSLICYRASPGQKVALVDFLRANTTARCLAIGDGANDIAMIRHAHVGVGILGKEGNQAASHADFSIGKFHFLKKLLLVHGHWNHYRQTLYLWLVFYKVSILYTGPAIYISTSLFTGTNLYESWTFTQYNTLFTSLPLLVFGATYQRSSEKQIMDHPELYADPEKQSVFPLRLVVHGLLLGASQTIILFSMAMYMYADIPGNYADVYSFGTLIFFATVTVVLVKILLLTLKPYTTLSYSVLVFEVFILFLWHIILSLTYKANTHMIVRHTFFYDLAKQNCFWASWIIMAAVAIAWDLFTQAISKSILFAKKQRISGRVGPDIQPELELGTKT